MSRFRRAAALAGVSLFALTACGADVHPGVAARVGEETISITRLDELATDMCEAIQSDPRGQGQVFAMGQLRSTILQVVALRSAAEQLAEEYAVDPGPDYRAAVRGYEQQLSSLPEDVQESALEVLTADPYIQDVLVNVGRAQLEEEGLDRVRRELAFQRGNETLQAWTVEHDVSVDPRFNLELTDQLLQHSPDQTSVAISEVAQLGEAEQPDPAYVASLPSTQKCG